MLTLARCSMLLLLTSASTFACTPTGASTSTNQSQANALPEPLDVEPALTELCPTSSDCPYRAVFAPTLSVFASPTDTDALVSDAKRSYGPAAILELSADAARVAVVCERDNYSTRVFVDRRALRHVTVELVTATLSPGDPPPSIDGVEVGVSLVPGTAVIVLANDGDFVEVEFESEVVRGRGWIPKAAIGQLYIPMEKDRRERPEGRANIVSRPSFDVLDQPHGRVLATVDGPSVVLPFGPRRDGHVLVATAFVLEERTYAVGWIAEATADAKAQGIPGGIPAGHDFGQATIAVAAGSTLVSAEGRELGLVHKATRLECHADCATKSPQVMIDCVTRFPARVVAP